jgi:hypothetical protein
VLVSIVFKCVHTVAKSGCEHHDASLSVWNISASVGWIFRNFMFGGEGGGIFIHISEEVSSLFNIEQK